MGVTRILDLIVIILLATVVLMPRPDASVKPALALDPERRARVAELQSILIGRPDAVDASVELANIFLDGHRPDWALATVSAAAAGTTRTTTASTTCARSRTPIGSRASRRSRRSSARSSCATQHAAAAPARPCAATPRAAGSRCWRRRWKRCRRST